MTSQRLDPTLRIIRGLIVSAALAAVLAAGPLEALADGTEALGPPSVPIAAGTDVIVAGVGLATGQPGTINLNVPAGATVKQVLLYFSGFFTQASDSPAAMTVQVAGNNVQGARIGGPTFFFTGNYPATYRADITALGLISPGANSVQVGGLAFTSVNHGAGLLVIVDDGSPAANIQVRDGTDTAFINFPDPRKETVAQTYNFPAATVARTAAISIFTASIKGQDLVSPLRPTTVEVSVDGNPPTIFFNQLGSNDGDEWDSLTVSVDVPAGATSLTVQVLSKDVTASGELPASLVWLASALSLPPDEVEIDCCRFGKPKCMKMLYTGEGPGASNHSQDAKKVSVVGDPQLASPVRIVAMNKSKLEEMNKADVWFDGMVNLGETFKISAANAGKDKLSSETFVFIISQAGAVLQTIKFHTSCSQPLNIGDQFGSIVVKGCLGEDQDDGPPAEPGCCRDGKPQVLTMEYTGEGPDASSHAQAAGKVSVVGDPQSASPVRIVAADKDLGDPKKLKKAKIFFDGQVALNGTFDIDATKVGKDKLGTNTYVRIYSDTGELLQSIKFHTSCSQPLRIGDQFGSLKLVGCKAIGKK